MPDKYLLNEDTLQPGDREHEKATPFILWTEVLLRKATTEPRETTDEGHEKSSIHKERRLSKHHTSITNTYTPAPLPDLPLPPIIGRPDQRSQNPRFPPAISIISGSLPSYAGRNPSLDRLSRARSQTPSVHNANQTRSDQTAIFPSTSKSPCTITKTPMPASLRNSKDDRS